MKSLQHYSVFVKDFVTSLRFVQVFPGWRFIVFFKRIDIGLNLNSHHSGKDYSFPINDLCRVMPNIGLML